MLLTITENNLPEIKDVFEVLGTLTINVDKETIELYVDESEFEEGLELYGRTQCGLGLVYGEDMLMKKVVEIEISDEFEEYFEEIDMEL